MTDLSLQVSASSDDALEIAGGTVYLTGTFHHITVAGAHFGFRFQSVTIPSGATINSATLQVYVHHIDNDDAYLDIYGEDEDDAGTFTTTANDLQDRTRTTAKVDWDEVGTGIEWRSPADIATIIQEIINREGWASGNALVILMDTQAGIDFQIRFYDYAGNTYGAKLDITYSVAIDIVVNDSAAGGDMLGVMVALGLSDTGSGEDGAPGQAANVPLGDGGVGVDYLDQVQAWLAAVDAGSGAELPGVVATLAVSDAGASAEGVEVLAQIFNIVADAVSGSDALAVAVSLAVSDIAQSTGLVNIAVTLAVTDASAGTDALSVLAAIVKLVQDIVVGTDAVGSVSVNVPIGDTAQGMTALAMLVSLLVVDLGSGVDVVVKRTGAQIATITFTIAWRSMVFSLVQRSTAFGLAQRNMTFSLVGG